VSAPSHHGPDGRFLNPWPMAAGDDGVRRQFWRVARTFLLARRPPNPHPSALPMARPEVAYPTVDAGEARITWIGHASTLIQLPGLNVLTDPVWSERCSPFRALGPRRFVPPPLALAELPPVHAVLLSHDHYDHLDRPTIEALHARFGAGLTWLTPLRYAEWLGALGIERVVERDWWEGATLPGGRFRAVAVPARHWTRRKPLGTNQRLWCGWVVVPEEGPVGVPFPGQVDAASTTRAPSEPPPQRPRIWFAGDSGYCPAFAEIGRRLGPFDASLVPIGAYEPRWFMEPSHMSPEEAVRSYRDVGGRGAFVSIHWGTFRLTLEDPLEPPVRVRTAWEEAGLPAAGLHLVRHGETLRIP
jgi:N-acyl-phosphatidylethanolamine-hydrolysing phospholipase D